MSLGLHQISATMAAALAMAHEHGGTLTRYQGGFWSWSGAPRDHNGIPVEWFNTSTIEALVKRRRLQYSEYKQGHRHRFPVTVTLTPDTESTDGN